MTTTTHPFSNGNGKETGMKDSGRREGQGKEERERGRMDGAGRKENGGEGYGEGEEENMAGEGGSV